MVCMAGEHRGGFRDLPQARFGEHGRGAVFYARALVLEDACRGRGAVQMPMLRKGGGAQCKRGLAVGQAGSRT